MKAFILAAGLGSRLGDITKNTPKCLVEVGGKPLIGHVIERFASVGITSFIVNTFYLAEKVEAYLESRKNEFEIHISREPELLGTGGAIQCAARFFDDAPFFLHNADILSDIDLHGLKAHHDSTHASATLAVMNRETSRYLVFNSVQDLCGWKNKDGTHVGGAGTQLAFSGVQIISPDLIPFFLNKTPPFSTITTFLDAAANGKKITSYRCDNSYWCDVGTLESLEAARKKYE